MNIDLRNITERDWELILDVYAIASGFWDDLEGACEVLRSSCALCQEKGLEDLWASAAKWVSFEMLRTESGIWYTRVSQWLNPSFYQSISPIFEISENQIWYDFIPKGYRGLRKTWWCEFLYGASSFSFWCDSEGLLMLYALKDQIERGDLEDISDLYTSYTHLKKTLQTQLTAMWNQSWWWHRTLRNSIQRTQKALEDLEASLVLSLRSRCLENPETAGRLLLDTEFYEGIFSKAFPKADQDWLVQNWKLSPWIGLYESRREGEDVACYWDLWVSESYTVIRERPYQLAKMALRWMKRPHRIEEIDRLFSSGGDRYIGFWSQFERIARRLQQTELASYLENRLAHIWYSQKALSKGLDRLSLDRVNFLSHGELAKQYLDDISDQAVKRYYCLTKTLRYQFETKLSFRRLKEIQIQWKSVDMVRNLPLWTEGYVKDLVDCIRSHDQISQAAMLQAYMMTVGRYMWVHRYKKNELKILLEGLNTVPFEIVKLGVQRIEKGLCQKEEKLCVKNSC